LTHAFVLHSPVAHGHIKRIDQPLHGVRPHISGNIVFDWDNDMGDANATDAAFSAASAHSRRDVKLTLEIEAEAPVGRAWARRQAENLA
jgi:hypothetical protein